MVCYQPPIGRRRTPSVGRQPPLAPPAPLMGGSKRDREKQKQLHQSRILSPGLMAACAVTLFSALSAQRVLRPQDDEQRTCDERAGAGECAESSLAMLRSCAASCGLPKSQRFPLDLVSAMGSLDWGKRTGWHAELEQKLRRSRPAGKCRIDDPNSNEPCRLIYWDAVQPLLTEAHQQHPRSAFAAQQLARSLLARVQVEAALALAAAVPKAPLVRWFAAQVLAHAGRLAESAALYAELFAEARVAALTDGRFAAALAPPHPRPTASSSTTAFTCTSALTEASRHRHQARVERPVRLTYTAQGLQPVGRKAPHPSSGPSPSLEPSASAAEPIGEAEAAETQLAPHLGALVGASLVRALYQTRQLPAAEEVGWLPRHAPASQVSGCGWSDRPRSTRTLSAGVRRPLRRSCRMARRRPHPPEQPAERPDGASERARLLPRAARFRAACGRRAALRASGAARPRTGHACTDTCA